MSTQHGGGENSGASPAEPTVVEPDPAAAAAVGADERAGDAAGVDDAGDSAETAGVEPDEAAEPDAGIRAAGGTVIGESEIAGLADRSRVRRAPRYKRFAVLGALVGLLLAAVATPFAQFGESLSPWGLFLLLVTILVPFLILVSCAVAMFSDRAARVPPRQPRKKRAPR